MIVSESWKGWGRGGCSLCEEDLVDCQEAVQHAYFIVWWMASVRFPIPRSFSLCLSVCLLHTLSLALSLPLPLSLPHIIELDI